MDSEREALITCAHKLFFHGRHLSLSVHDSTEFRAYHIGLSLQIVKQSFAWTESIAKSAVGYRSFLTRFGTAVGRHRLEPKFALGYFWTLEDI